MKKSRFQCEHIHDHCSRKCEQIVMATYSNGDYKRTMCA